MTLLAPDIVEGQMFNAAISALKGVDGSSTVAESTSGTLPVDWVGSREYSGYARHACQGLHEPALAIRHSTFRFELDFGVGS